MTNLKRDVRHARTQEKGNLEDYCKKKRLESGSLTGTGGVGGEEEEEEEEGGEFFLESTVTSYQEGQRVEIKQDSVSGLWRLEYILRLLMQILRACIESGRSPL